jgi:hypothetical protein
MIRQIQRYKYQKQKRPKLFLSLLETFMVCPMVAHTGVEPVISALRGRRPGPLDECAMSYSLVTL